MNCYAERLSATRLSQTSRYRGLAEMKPSGPHWIGTVRLADDELTKPLHWTKPRRIFVADMGDLFHDAVPDAWIDRVFAVIAVSPRHTFQVLTKRADRLKAYMQALGTPRGYTRLESAARALGYSLSYEQIPLVPWPIPNLWLGVSVETPAYYTRIRALQETPARIRFLSLEPLLEPLKELPLHGIHWCIVGGESGPGARVCRQTWVRDILHTCHATHSACYVKQLGRVSIADNGMAMRFTDHKGSNPDEWPEDLRVREFPD
jgi:protein gp37